MFFQEISFMFFPRPLLKVALRTSQPLRMSLMRPIWQSRTIPLVRFQSNVKKPDDSDNHQLKPEGTKKVIPADVYETQQVINRRIPGQKVQTNSMADRFPSSWKFEQEAVPTLLPRPGVPEPNRYPLARMYQSLKAKKEPELIYEAEPHKLYFVFCYAFAFVFLVYGMNALTIGWDLTWGMYYDNDMNLDKLHLDMELAMHIIMVLGLALLPISAGVGLICLPTRLIRRMWYLPGAPGREAYIRFTTHPLIANRATPVRVIPVSKLQKSVTAKIYSGKGFYGVTDSSFFFFLRANNSRIPYIVDRKGFFWGDGRVFDLLFSKDSVDSVETSKKIDEVYGDMLKERRANQEKLKQKYGFGWRTKAAGKLMIDDVKQVIGEAKENDDKLLDEAPEKSVKPVKAKPAKAKPAKAKSAKSSKKSKKGKAKKARKA